MSVEAEAANDREGDLFARIAELEAALAEETRRAEALNRIATAIGSGRDLDAVVQAVVDGGVELTGARFGAFFYNVIGEEGEAYTLYVISGVPRSAFDKFPMPRNTAVFAPTFTGEGVVRSDDITADPRYGKNKPHKGMPQGHLPVRSYLAVPVKAASGEVLGGLFFGHPETGRFSARHEAVMEGLASQAAAAVGARREIDDRRRAEAALRESEARFAALADGIPTLCWMAKPDGHIFWYNRGWHDYTGTSLTDMEGWGWQAVHDPEILPSVMERWNGAIATGEPLEMIFPLRGADGVFRRFLTRVTPLRDADGAVVRWFGINTDVEEITRAQERQDLLLNELNHRVKNTLATVQSIAFQTLRSARSPSDFRDAFEARLMALSQTHNLLTQEGWLAASLNDIVKAELEPYGVEDSRLVLRAERDVRLNAKAAVALGMAMHELVTNAAKYGALSHARGVLDISWRVIERDGERRLLLDWCEEGAPSVEPPQRRGFGARLLEQGLAAELGGEVRLKYDPRGVRCAMDLPMSMLEPHE